MVYSKKQEYKKFKVSMVLSPVSCRAGNNEDFNDLINSYKMEFADPASFNTFDQGPKGNVKKFLSFGKFFQNFFLRNFKN